MLDLSYLTTERNNEKTKNIDTLTTIDMLKVFNEEDEKIHKEIAKEIDVIAELVDIVAEAFRKNGRLIYLGAGTSGRLGVLDASECPPTFGVCKDMVQGVIAGGDYALRNAIEGAEDDYEKGVLAIKERKVTKDDVVVGITASGRTKFVIGAIEEANRIGAYTAGICNNKNTKLHDVAKITISPDVGAEVIQGSTRLKAGTSQKLILNMITTTAMIKIGKVYKNYMVDMKASNEKLKDRAIRLVMEITESSYEDSLYILQKCDFNVKIAIVMIIHNCECEDAIKLLDGVKGHIAKIVRRDNDK